MLMSGWLLENAMTSHFSILAWRIPWTEDPDRLYIPWRRKELDMTEQLTLALHMYVLNYLD